MQPVIPTFQLGYWVEQCDQVSTKATAKSVQAAARTVDAAVTAPVTAGRVLQLRAAMIPTVIKVSAIRNDRTTIFTSNPFDVGQQNRRPFR